MSARNSLSNSAILFLTCSSMAGFFVLDLLLPNGYANGVLYLVSLFMSLLASRLSISVIVILMINVLVVVGFFLSPMSPDAEFFKEAANRVVVLLLAWIIVIIGWQFKRNYAARLFLASIVDSSEDAIIGINLKGKIVSWNKGAERLIGYAYQEVKRKRIFKILIDPNDYHHNILLDKMKQGLALDYHELVLEKKYGGEFYATLSMAPVLDSMDHVIGFSMIIRDTSHLKTAEIQKEDYRKKLEQEVVVRTQELVTMNDRLKQLAAYSNKAIESERAHLAREVHDHLGQLLTALKMDIAAVHRKLDDHVDESMRKRFDGMGQVIDELVASVQKVVSRLRPSVLDNLGLIPALEWQLDEFKRRSDLECFFVCKIDNVDNIDVDEDPAVALFRIFQEALTNIARHANAQNVMIYVALGDGYFKLAIKDDGQGAKQDSLKSSTSFGLIGMTERVAPFDGVVDIQSQVGKGTTVSVFLPDRYIKVKSEV